MGADSKTKKLNNYFDGLPVSSMHMKLFFVVILGFFFEQLDNNNFSYIAPALMKSWHIARPQIAQITSAYFLGMTLGGLCGGVISDLIGRRKTFLGAILIFSSMSVLNGITNDFNLFVMSRALTGFGIFCMMVVAITYMSEMSPAESRGKWLSITAAAGFIAMPVIAFIARAVIPTSVDAWKIIFYLGGFGIIGFIFGLKYLKESPRWLVSKGRVAEAEKIVEDLTGVAVDLSEAAKQTTKKANSLEQITQMFSIKYLKRTILLLLILIPYGVGTFAGIVWLPTLVVGAGFTLAQSLDVGVACALGAPAGIYLSSFFSDKGGRKIPIGIGALCIAASAAILTVTISSHSYLGVLIFAFLLNASVMATGFTYNPYIAEHYPTKMRNTSVGVLTAAQRFSVSGSQLYIPVVVAGYGFSGFYLGVAGLAVFMALVVLIFGDRTGGKSLEDVE